VWKGRLGRPPKHLGVSVTTFNTMPTVSAACMPGARGGGGAAAVAVQERLDLRVCAMWEGGSARARSRAAGERDASTVG